VRWTFWKALMRNSHWDFPDEGFLYCFSYKTSMTCLVGGHPVNIIRSVYLCHVSALKMGGRNIPKLIARRHVLDECHFSVVDSTGGSRVYR